MWDHCERERDPLVADLGLRGRGAATLKTRGPGSASGDPEGLCEIEKLLCFSLGSTSRCSVAVSCCDLIPSHAS